LFYPLVRHYIKGLHERPKNVSKSKRMKFSWIWVSFTAKKRT
jgi:hypothetical protein